MYIYIYVYIYIYKFNNMCIYIVNMYVYMCIYIYTYIYIYLIECNALYTAFSELLTLELDSGPIPGEAGSNRSAVSKSTAL